VKETGAGNEAPRATADAAVSSVVDTNCPYAIPSDNTPEVPQTRKARLLDQLRFHSKRAVETHNVGVKQLGCDHALVFSTKSNPPPDVQHDGVGVVSLVYAGYASVTRGPALFVSFGSGAVMVYKAGSSEVSFVTTVSHGNGSSLTGTKTKPNPSVSKFALQPALRVPFPLWPGAKKGFIQIAPITDPTAPVLCVASTRNGPPAVYQLPSRNGVPPMRSVALPATESAVTKDTVKADDEGDGQTSKRGTTNPVASVCAFDPSGNRLVVGYENGGVLVWSR